jgi:hypothetical protein
MGMVASSMMNAGKFSFIEMIEPPLVLPARRGSGSTFSERRSFWWAPSFF